MKRKKVDKLADKLKSKLMSSNNVVDVKSMGDYISISVVNAYGSNIPQEYKGVPIKVIQNIGGSFVKPGEVTYTLV